MHVSPSATVLLMDFDNRSPYVFPLKSILEEANIEVLVHRNQAHPLDDQTPPFEVGNPHSPGLIIQLLDQERLPKNDVFPDLSHLTGLEVPLIVAAQNFEAKQIQRLLELGATDFITPPFTAANTLPRVWRLLKHDSLSKASCETLQEKLALQRLGLVGESPLFLEEIRKLRLLARCDITVMIGGETGTGKELIARAIHYLSPRSNRSFVPVDCGAIPPELTENELFGHERGAYTGAVVKSPGLISAADQGTVFLDEVDALTLPVQAKLLRFLQEMEYRPLGSTETKKADVRVICATNSDLLQRVRNNEFRSDLYYRLNNVQLRLPNLSQRREDILILAKHFIEKYAAKFCLPTRQLTREAMQKLVMYEWPGNIRELENVIGAAVALSSGPLICSADLQIVEAQVHLPTSFREAKARIVTQFEREYIERLLGSCDGNVSEAARAAGKNRRAFWELIRKHSIDVRGLRRRADKSVRRKANARARKFATS